MEIEEGRAEKSLWRLSVDGSGPRAGLCRASSGFRRRKDTNLVPLSAGGLLGCFHKTPQDIGFERLLLTDVKVAGRNKMVTAAIVRMTALSRDVLSATLLETSAMTFMAALSFWLASAILRELSAM